MKFALFAPSDTGTPFLRGQIEGVLGAARFLAATGGGDVIAERAWGDDAPPGHEGAVSFLLAWLASSDARGAADARIIGAGHRIVHGGRRRGRPARVDDALLRELEELVPLAPLHQPHGLAAIRAVSAAAPGVPQVACFDTSFHLTQPPIARALALPREHTGAGLERYGFHGLSYESVIDALRRLDPAATAGRVIVAHLGAGASLSAIRDGRSVATSMGFSALDGLVMATRCGSLDPGVIFHLHRRAGMSVDEIEAMLYERSGLLGVSGVSSDMRALLGSDDPRAAEAVDLFVYRLVREIGSHAAALGGVDAIVFTGGMGEHSAAIRKRASEGCAWLGARLDEWANERGGPRISDAGSAVNLWVAPSDEERVIARRTAEALGCAGGGRAGTSG